MESREGYKRCPIEKAKVINNGTRINIRSTDSVFDEKRECCFFSSKDNRNNQDRLCFVIKRTISTRAASQFSPYNLSYYNPGIQEKRTSKCIFQNRTFQLIITWETYVIYHKVICHVGKND